MMRHLLTGLIGLIALPVSFASAAENFVAEGKIREVTGPGKSRAMLVTDDNKSFTLESASSDLREELVRLSGVRVRLDAESRTSETPQGVPLQVLGYQILDVGGGIVPMIGHIALLQAGSERRMIFVTEDGHASLLPKTWTDRLVSHIGAKVWVVGQKDKDELKVRRFSILRVHKGPARAATKSP